MFQQQKTTRQFYHLPTQGTEWSLKTTFSVSLQPLPLLWETGMAPPINVVHVQIWSGGIYGLNLFLARTLLQGFFLVLHFSSLASTKTNISKLQFDQERRFTSKTSWCSFLYKYCTFINLFILSSFNLQQHQKITVQWSLVLWKYVLYPHLVTDPSLTAQVRLTVSDNVSCKWKLWSLVRFHLFV